MFAFLFKPMGQVFAGRNWVRFSLSDSTFQCPQKQR